MQKVSKTNKVLILVVTLIGMILPLITGQKNNYANNLYISYCYFAILAASLNLLMGYSGLISMGHASFMAIGAYSYAIFSKTLGIHFLIAMIMAIAFTFVCGVIVGSSSCKLSSIYLVMVTTAFSRALIVFIKNARDLTGGANGFTGIAKWKIFDFKLKNFHFVYVSIALALLVYLICYRLVNSKTGRAWRALKSAPIAASAMGVNVNYYKLLVNGIAAAIAGLAGVVYAVANAYISADMFANFSVKFVTMVVIGGLGTMWGPFLGALFVASMPELMRGASNYLDGVYGIALILCVMFMPRGLLGLVQDGAKKLISKIKPGAKNGPAKEG